MPKRHLGGQGSDLGTPHLSKHSPDHRVRGHWTLDRLCKLRSHLLMPGLLGGGLKRLRRQNLAPGCPEVTSTWSGFLRKALAAHPRNGTSACLQETPRGPVCGFDLTLHRRNSTGLHFQVALCHTLSLMVCVTAQRCHYLCFMVRTLKEVINLLEAIGLGFRPRSLKTKGKAPGTVCSS